LCKPTVRNRIDCNRGPVGAAVAQQFQTNSYRKFRPTALAARASVPSVTGSLSGSSRRSSWARLVLCGSPARSWKSPRAASARQAAAPARALIERAVTTSWLPSDFRKSSSDDPIRPVLFLALFFRFHGLAMMYQYWYKR
jgi:hypothetical protein